MERIKKFIGGFSTFEKIVLPLSLTALIAAKFVFDESFVDLACGLLLALCTAFATKGMIVNFYFGMAYAILYGLVCMSNKLWGSMALCFCYTFPVQIICMVQWIKNKSGANADRRVKVRSFSLKQKILLFAIVLAAGALLSYLLTLLGGSQAYLDSAVTVFSVVSMTLMILRYSECWVVNALAFACNTALWLTTLISGGHCVVLLVNSIVSLTFSVNGIVNWAKMERAQKSADQSPDAVE